MPGKPPTKIEAKTDEIMHRIGQHTDRIKEKLARANGPARMREAISRKHTRLAAACFGLEDSDDGCRGQGSDLLDAQAD